MSLKDITSENGKFWNRAESLVNGYTGYGHQMAVFRGELYGIMTQTVQYPGVMFANKFKDGKWKSSWITVSESWKTVGRVAVAVMDDRFYLCFRGWDTKMYITYTTDMTKWADLKQVLPTGGETYQAVSMTAFEGNLYVCHAGRDQRVYYTVINKDLNPTRSWVQMPTASLKSPALTAFGGKLYLFSTATDGKSFYYQTLDRTNGSWSRPQQVAGDVSSGPSATTFKDNKLYVAYRHSDKGIRLNSFDGSSWKGEERVCQIEAAAEVGISSWGGDLHISYSSGGDKLLMEQDIESDDELEMEKRQAATFSEPMKKMPRKWYSRFRCW